VQEELEASEPVSAVVVVVVVVVVAMDVVMSLARMRKWAVEMRAGRGGG
jgi:hypothetical protein